MPKKPKITIPATPNPDSGMLTVRGIVYVWYYENGKRRRGSLGSTSTPLHELMAKRDSFYALLKRQGATVAATPGRRKATKKARATSAAADPDLYIRQRMPWVVTIGGKVIAECKTKAEAKAARDSHLGVRAS